MYFNLKLILTLLIIISLDTLKVKADNTKIVHVMEEDVLVLLVIILLFKFSIKRPKDCFVLWLKKGD